ncbi:MAG: hypothetical protein CME63_07770 [Halobacteriovoraceae bacterium]|nr:hypothetical protein [Halobacteriovoraceae bacterium]|tara:strand:+ start:23318 stop:23515 length:198 start_codon:yes stop_codon:yes gene_type:complete
MNFEQAVALLKNAVKYSHIEGQKHIDLTLVDASERPEYQKALALCRAQVAQNLISEDELRDKLGL